MVKPLRFAVGIAAVLNGTRVSLAKTISASATETNPDVASVVAEVNELSAVTDKINDAMKKQERLVDSHGDYKRYYENKKKSVNTQIKIRKQQVGSQSKVDDAAYRQEQKDHLRSLTCTIIMDAFVYDNVQDKKLKVMDICLGRHNLTLSQKQASVHSTDVVSAHLRGRRSRQSSESIGSEVKSLRSQIKDVIARENKLEKGDAFIQSPVSDMREKLAALDKHNGEMAAELAKDKEDWQKEIDELSAEEKELGDKHYDTYNTREKIESEVFDEIKGKFCPIVHAHYGMSEDEMGPILEQECAVEEVF